MNRLKVILMILIFSYSFFSFPSFSEERNGKAVFEISPELGMRLTEKALKNIEVKTLKLATLSNYSVPPGSIVHFQDQTGVYRLREGWFKLVKVRIIKKNDREAFIDSSELKAQDELVVFGADLLRVAEMDAFGSGE
jgi:hypothetical protein